MKYNAKTFFLDGIFITRRVRSNLNENLGLEYFFYNLNSYAVTKFVAFILSLSKRLVFVIETNEEFCETEDRHFAWNHINGKYKFQALFK